VHVVRVSLSFFFFSSALWSAFAFFRKELRRTPGEVLAKNRQKRPGSSIDDLWGEFGKLFLNLPDPQFSLTHLALVSVTRAASAAAAMELKMAGTICH